MNQQDDNKFFSSGNSFLDYKIFVKKIINIWPYILGTCVFFLGYAYYYNKQETPVYQVGSMFFIKEERSPLGIFSEVPSLGNSNEGLINEMIILKSRPVAYETLKNLDFQVEQFTKGRFRYQEIYGQSPLLVEVDWKHPQLVEDFIEVSWSSSEGYTINFEEKSYSQLMQDGSKVSFEQELSASSYSFGEWAETAYYKFKISLTNADEEGGISIRLKDMNSLIAEYANNLQIDQVQMGASILNLTLRSPDSKKGERYLNSLMNRYLELELEQKNIISDNTIKFIDSQVSGVGDSLTSIENRLENFRSSNMIFDLTTESSTVYNQLVEYENQKATEQFKRNYYQRLQEYLENEEYSELIMPSGLGIEDPYLNSTINNLMDLQVQKSSMLATQTEASPAVIEVNKKIRDLNSSIQEILKNVDTNSEMIIQDLDSRIESMEGSFRNLPGTQQNLIKLERGFALNENIYTYLMEKRAEAAISKASNFANNKIIEPARSFGQISPTPTKNYLIALLLGLFAPIGFIVGKEILKTRISEIYYLEKKLKTSLLGVILVNSGKENLVVIKQFKSAITEGFRSLRSNIKFILPQDKQLTLMVTSTISGEGKTFIAMNLASVYAITGKKTLLIGCDMRKPKIYDDFEVKNDVGLSNYLSEQENSFEKVIKKSKIENLDLMISGPVPPNPAELLASERLDQMVNELKAKYEVIILDTPPVGLVSETLELLTYVDLTLFVFRQNYSKKVFVDSLNNLKKSKNIKNIYAIFNGVDAVKTTYGYGYSYGYGYGYEYGTGYYEEGTKLN